ncbi:MAG: HAD family hydrolase, partial [Pseudomonadota bacterium]
MARGLHPAPGGGNLAAGNPADFAHVDTIVMDLDDTIVSGTPALLAYVETLYQGLARMSRLPIEKVAEGFKGIRAQEIYAFANAFNDHGPLKDKFPHRDLNEEFALVREQANKAMIEALDADPDFIAAIDGWHAKGYRLIVMTEGPGSATAMKLDAVGLTDKIDQVAVVAETTPTGINDIRDAFPGKLWSKLTTLPAGFKEQPALIAEALKSWGVDPNRAVMIGNRVDRDLAPMQELGANTIHMRQYDRANEDALKKRFMELIFAGQDLPPGSGAAITDDVGGITP